MPFILGLIGNKYVMGILAALALMVGMIYAWEHYIANPYRAQGAAAMRAKLQPALDKAVAQLNADADSFAEIAASMKAITDKSAARERELTEAKRINTSRQAAERSRIETIKKLIPVGATDCDQIQDLINRSLRK